jgi:hypothetical protein
MANVDHHLVAGRIVGQYRTSTVVIERSNMACLISKQDEIA